MVDLGSQSRVHYWLGRSPRSSDSGKNALVVAALFQFPSSGFVLVLLGEACVHHTEAWKAANTTRFMSSMESLPVIPSALHIAATFVRTDAMPRYAWTPVLGSTAQGLRFLH